MGKGDRIRVGGKKRRQPDPADDLKAGVHSGVPSLVQREGRQSQRFQEKRRSGLSNAGEG